MELVPEWGKRAFGESRKQTGGVIGKVDGKEPTKTGDIIRKKEAENSRKKSETGKELADQFEQVN